MFIIYLIVEEEGELKNIDIANGCVDYIEISIYMCN
jgi:hypothetical protein